MHTRNPNFMQKTCIYVLLGMRILQYIQYLTHFSKPIVRLTPMQTTPLIFSSFIVAPLVLYLFNMRFRTTFRTYNLIRSGRLCAVIARYLKLTCVDSFILVGFLQGSGAVLCFMEFNSPSANDLLQYTLATVFLIGYYIAFACIVLLTHMCIEGIVSNILIQIVFIWWDFFALFFTYLISNEIYLGWRLIEQILYTSSQLIVISLCRYIGLCLIIVGLITISMTSSRARCYYIGVHND